MQIPGVPSLLFLFYILVFLPVAAVRSAGRIRAAREGTGPALPSRSAISAGVTAQMLLLFGLSWFVGSSFGYQIFDVPQLGLREVGLAVLAFVALAVMGVVSRSLRSPDELRQMSVFLLAPRSLREWLGKAATIVSASVPEEAGC